MELENKYWDSTAWPKKITEAKTFVQELLLLEGFRGTMLVPKTLAVYIAKTAMMLKKKQDWFSDEEISIIFFVNRTSPKGLVEMSINPEQVQNNGSAKTKKANPCFDCSRYKECPKVQSAELILFRYPFLEGIQSLSQKQDFVYIKSCDAFKGETRSKASKGASAYLEQDRKEEEPVSAPLDKLAMVRPKIQEISSPEVRRKETRKNFANEVRKISKSIE